MSILLLFMYGLIVWVSYRKLKFASQQDVTLPKFSKRLNQLWINVKDNIKNEKFNQAERNLLNILDIDHKNTAAYNQLGIIYAKQNNLEEAIECFDIASSITPTVSTLYNLGLVQYEAGHYTKSSTTFERVVDLEPTTKRYIAYAKSLEKSSSPKKVVEVLEKAALADRKSPILFELLSHAYTDIKSHDLSKKALQKAEKLRKANKTK
jgi:tetratricopeptide (TPR) repeat protein